MFSEASRKKTQKEAAALTFQNRTGALPISCFSERKACAKPSLSGAKREDGQSRGAEDTSGRMTLYAEAQPLQFTGLPS